MVRTCDICGKRDETVSGWKRRGEKSPAFQVCDKCIGTKAFNKLVSQALGHTKPKR